MQNETRIATLLQSGQRPALAVFTAATVSGATIWPASGPVVPPPLMAPVSHLYYLGVGAVQSGPFQAVQIAHMFAAGSLRLEGTKVWRQGLASWVDLVQLEELAPHLRTAPPPLSGIAMPPPLM